MVCECFHLIYIIALQVEGLTFKNHGSISLLPCRALVNEMGTIRGPSWEQNCGTVPTPSGLTSHPNIHPTVPSAPPNRPSYAPLCCLCCLSCCPPLYSPGPARPLLQSVQLQLPFILSGPHVLLRLCLPMHLLFALLLWVAGPRVLVDTQLRIHVSVRCGRRPLLYTHR